MLLPFAFIILAAQASAFPVKVPGRPKTCEGNRVVPEPITDFQQLNGDWYGLYYFYNISKQPYDPKVPREQCPEVYVTKLTLEGIEEQKSICQLISDVYLDLDKEEIKGQDVEDFTIHVAKSVKYYYTLNFCTKFLKVSDDMVLIDPPEGADIRILMARYVPREKELSRIVDNIEGLDEYKGLPFC